MRANSYSYYNLKKYLRFADQTSMRNVLKDSNDTNEHYVIVPRSWFNSYLGDKKKGDFLVHLAGRPKKSKKPKDLHLLIKNDIEWYTAMTNKDLRKIVLEYYNLPKEQQLKVYYFISIIILIKTNLSFHIFIIILFFFFKKKKKKEKKKKEYYIHLSIQTIIKLLFIQIIFILLNNFLIIV